MDPPEYLGLLLHDARVLGYAFDAAWPIAMGQASRISSTPREWAGILASTRDAWERAFDVLPATMPERALQAVGHALHPDIDLELEARRCKQCDRWIPTDRDRRAECCSEKCGRQWKYDHHELERPRAKPSAPAGWDASRAARPCENCTTNWVPLDRERFCCDWCAAAAESRSARTPK